MMVLTGPMLCAGKELAESASKALGQTMEFDNISESVTPAIRPVPHPTMLIVGFRREAKRVLKNQADIDDSEKEYLLEYYSLVREGKTNYISTTAFHDVTGLHPTEPGEFFSMYAGDLRPKKKLRSS
jgi:hypothetical protein